MQPTATTPATAATATTFRDPQLWAKARARTKFRGHLGVYLLVNAGLWALYFLTNEPAGRSYGRYDLPWPVWTSLFWGLGLAIQGFTAYSSLNRGDATQREYERLLRQQQ